MKKYVNFFELFVVCFLGLENLWFGDKRDFGSYIMDLIKICRRVNELLTRFRRLRAYEYIIGLVRVDRN